MKVHRLSFWPALRAFLCLPLISACLLACTPALDWRDVRNGDAGYKALFPGKPVSASRDFVMAGTSVTLKLQATTVNGAYFAVGEIPLQAEQQAQADAILTALKASLLNNIGAQADSAKERSVSAGAQQWQELRATGQMRTGAASVLAGRFLVQSGRIIEVLAMGERAQLSDDTIDMWLGSVVLEPRP